MTPAETVRRICFAGAPTAPSRIAAYFPLALEPVVMRALAKDPAERHATALELATELSRVAADLAPQRGIGEYLRDLLADNIARRQEFLEHAIEAAEMRRKARDAPTLPPPCTKSPPPGLSDPRLLALSSESDSSSASLSSLRALIVSSTADGAAPPEEATGAAPLPPSRIRRRMAHLVALAAVFATGIVLALALTGEGPSPERPAHTSLGAPMRLVENTLATLRAKAVRTNEKPTR
jgi:hypothetical protein